VQMIPVPRIIRDHMSTRAAFLDFL